MFLQASVILLTAGLPQCMLGNHSPCTQRRPPPEETPGGGNPPPSGDPLGGDPPPQSMLGDTANTRWRYASYWNAILFHYFSYLAF